MQLIDIATFSRKHFFFFVDKCNETYRFGDDLAFYRKLILMHRECANIEILLVNDEFYQLLYRTLEKWNMNQRAARLVPLDTMKQSILFHKTSLCELYKYKLYDDIYDDLTQIKKLLDKVFCDLKIMKSQRRIVGVSKALHFLLPDLIMPIDGNYTLDAFYGYNKYANTANKEFVDFWNIFERSFDIAEKLELRKDDADGEIWKQSVPKLIDNAVIGLRKCTKEEILGL